MGNVKPTPPHGSASRYSNQGCRCDECRAAQAAYSKAWYEKNATRCAQVGKTWREANKEARAVKRRSAYLANREHELATTRAWDQRNKARRAAHTASYVARNPDKVRARQAAYVSRNKAEILRRHRNWNDRNRYLTVLYAADRRARHLAADRRIITAADWLRLCGRYGGCCAYCGKPDLLSQDHIVPLTRGGRHSIGNLLPACKPCNSSKGSKLLIEWLAHRIIL